MAKDKSSSLVKYEIPTPDDVKADREDLDNSRGPNVFLSMKSPGKYTMRFLPAPKGRKWKRVTYMHYLDSPGVGRVSFLCPKMEAKKACVACKMEAKLRSSTQEIDQKRAEKFAPKRRCLANVIDRAHPDEGPKVFAFGVTIERELQTLMEDEDRGGMFLDPLKGYDVCVVREGSGQMDTKYTTFPANKGRVCPVSEEAKEMNEWLETQNNLERFVKVYSDADQQRLMNGEKPLGNSDEDEAPRGKKAASIDDEIENKFDSDDEEDDDKE